LVGTEGYEPTDDYYMENPPIGETFISYESSEVDHPYYLIVYLGTSAEGHAKGFSAKYIQYCSHSNDYWYTSVFTATDVWKTTKDSFPDHAVHPYGISGSWLIRPAHVGCKVKIVFNMVRDTTSW
jgi:hypothetical protein